MTAMNCSTYPSQQRRARALADRTQDRRFTTARADTFVARLHAEIAERMRTRATPRLTIIRNFDPWSRRV